MVEHELKTLSNYWDAVLAGDKTFEVRRDDRGFQKGDILNLKKWNGKYYELEGDRFSSILSIRKRITYVLTGGQFGVEPGYVVLGLGEPSPTPPDKET